MNEIKLGKYRHYSGREYELVGIARHSETLEEMVIYRALYDSEEFGMWVRPKEMFSEKVKIGGKEVKRFELIIRKKV
jgi:hypothetical protein